MTPWHRVILSVRLARMVRWATKCLYGGHPVDAITVSHTTLFLISAPLPQDLLDHEFMHVCQAARYEPGWWPRWLGRLWVGAALYGCAYLLEYTRHGYLRNRFEVEARRAAGQEE